MGTGTGTGTDTGTGTGTDTGTDTGKSKLSALNMDPNAGKNGSPHTPANSKKKSGGKKEKPKSNSDVSITCKGLL